MSIFIKIAKKVLISALSSAATPLCWRKDHCAGAFRYDENTRSGARRAVRIHGGWSPVDTAWLQPSVPPPVRPPKPTPTRRPAAAPVSADDLLRRFIGMTLIDVAPHRRRNPDSVHDPIILVFEDCSGDAGVLAVRIDGDFNGNIVAHELPPVAPCKT